MPCPSSSLTHRARRQTGLTLVELLVSVALSGLIAVATIALYTATTGGLKTVDAEQELQDSGRFALEQIGLAVAQAGYQNFDQTNATGSVTRYFATPTYSPIQGASNAKITSIASQAPQDFGTTNNGGFNSSDTFGVLFQGRTLAGTVNTADPSMVDCQGSSKPMPTGPNDLMVSLFWIREVAGEPHLECISNGATVRNSQPIVKGVEVFRVVYGVLRHATSPGVLAPTDARATPNAWLQAKDMTAIDWVNVAMIRVGMVIRAAPGSAQSAGPSKLYPLGQNFSAGDATLEFTPPADRRLRRVFTATFSSRNDLRSGPPPSS